MADSKVSVHDVAAHVLRQQGPMSAMKLQKLVYYSQAWSLAWVNEPLFTNAVEAWIKGPIIRALWRRHKGRHLLTRWDGEGSAWSPRQTMTVNRVLMFYGGLSATDLSTLTHSEKPWRDARKGLDYDEPGTREITPTAMWEHYGATASLINSSDPFEMVSNFVRQLPDGTWGVNVHPRPLYVGYAMKMLAPLIKQIPNDCRCVNKTSA
jgi:uncharacterized phage-associated protein